MNASGPVAPSSRARDTSGRHDSDFGAVAAVLRGAGAVSSVGASLRVYPVASVAVDQKVATSALPAAPLAGGSAAPSVAATSRACLHPAISAGLWSG